MENYVKSKSNKGFIKVRGTATIYEDNAFEFVSQKEAAFPDAKERPILLDIIEDRHERKSIVMASQLPVENWYDTIGDQAVADAVLNRIVHSSHRIELTGESIRKMMMRKGSKVYSTNLYYILMGMQTDV